MCGCRGSILDGTGEPDTRSCVARKVTADARGSVEFYNNFFYGLMLYMISSTKNSTGCSLG